MDWPSLAPKEVLNAMKAGSKIIGEGHIPIDFGWASLASAATENPVAVAIAYKKIVHDIMTILVGLSPATTSGDNNRNLKTAHKDWNKKGVIVGTPIAFLGVLETSARGSLHFHVGESLFNTFFCIALKLHSHH